MHARGQVVHVDVDAAVDPAALVQGRSTPCSAPRSWCAAPSRVADAFDARRSARSRRYRYLVLESEAPTRCSHRFAWHVKDRLDLRAMVAAADALLGEHDFRAFCRRAPGPRPGRAHPPAGARRPLGRGAAAPAGEPSGDEARLLRFGIEAQSFCHQMVRSIVGTLVDVGRGRHRASDVVWFLLGRPSAAARHGRPTGCA